MMKKKIMMMKKKKKKNRNGNQKTTVREKKQKYTLTKKRGKKKRKKKATIGSITDEINDDNKMNQWREIYEIFKHNKDQKPYGHYSFKYHFAVYCGLRLFFKKKGSYNPTKAMLTVLYKHDEVTKKYCRSFFKNKLNMSEDEIMDAFVKGNAFHFKRCISVPQMKKKKTYLFGGHTLNYLIRWTLLDSK